MASRFISHPSQVVLRDSWVCLGLIVQARVQQCFSGQRPVSNTIRQCAVLIADDTVEHALRERSGVPPGNGRTKRWSFVWGHLRRKWPLGSLERFSLTHTWRVQRSNTHCIALMGNSRSFKERRVEQLCRNKSTGVAEAPVNASEKISRAGRATLSEGSTLSVLLSDSSQDCIRGQFGMDPCLC